MSTPVAAPQLAAQEAGQLKRILRVRDGLAVTVGIVIGAGILGGPGLIAGYLGNTWIILAVWLLGGVMAALSTLVLAEMAAALPLAGGKYVYAREAYGPVMGFVAGWSEVFVTRGFSGAAKAVLIATYLVSLMGFGSVKAISAGVILAYVLINLAGLRAGKTFQNVTTVIKVLVLLAIAAAGIGAGDAASFGAAAGEVAPGAATGGVLLAFALAYQNVSFAYYGWEDASKLAGETRDPGRSMPRILLGGAAAVAVLYLLMNVAFLSALTPAEMAGSELVARDAIAAAFGDSAGTLVVVASLLILISSLNVNFMGLPRVAFGLARDGLAPRIFTRVSEAGTPVPGLLFISTVILVLTLSGTFEDLIRFMMLVAISVDTMVLSAILRLRKTRPELERPFRVPGYPWIPILTLTLNGVLLAIIVWTQPVLARGAGIMLGVLLVAGWWTARRQRAPGPA
jgi:APA family basic amino acid/polyamine antiporter